ncbi:MAG: hypothetical protein Fur0012_03600 [Elusimicrobiota bacterium]
MTNETLQKDIMRMRNNISSIFDNFLTNRYQENTAEDREGGIDWMPDVDVKETKDDFVLHVALPGVKKENVETEIKDSVLTISGKREVKENDGDNWLRREIASGQFYRAFKIGARVKNDAVKASFKDGILEIRLPKADEAKPNKIQID